MNSADETADSQDSEYARFFSRHLVAFVCSYQHLDNAGGPEGDVRLSVYSGFVMSFQNIWFYVTAGHCLAQFLKAADDPRIVIHETFLADYFTLEPKSRETFPFNCLRDRPVQYIDDNSMGLDFGFIPIYPHERRWLEANGIVALDEIQWCRQDGLTFDAHLMLGIPEQYTSPAFRTTDSNLAIRVNPTLLQLVEETQPADVVSQQPWYVGRIPEKIRIEDIAGMSGGPVFGLKILPEKQLKYWVIALQSWWRPDERLAFACRLSVFAPLIEEWLLELVDKLRNRDSPSDNLEGGTV